MPLLGLLLIGCTAASTTSSAEQLRLQGRVYASGNEPFVGLLLATEANNLYALELEPGERDRLRAQLPAEVEVTGTVALGDWMGRPFAVLRVQAWRVLVE